MAQYDITKLNNGFTFSDGTNEFIPMSVCALDETHFIAFYLSDTGTYPSDCYAKVFEFNPSTGQISSVGDYWNRLELPVVYSNGRAFKIDSTHVIFIGSHPSYASGNSCIVTVDTSTWAISLALSNYEWDSDTRDSVDIIQYSSTKYLVTYESTSSSRGRAKLLSVNTSNWTISILSSIANYFTTDLASNSSAMLDSTHFVTVYESEGGDGYLSVLEINQSTYEITHLVSYEYDTSSSRPQLCARVDDNKFIVFWSRSSGPTYSRVFSINYSNNVITPLGDLTNVINYQTLPRIPIISLGSNKFLISYYKRAVGQCVDIFEVNTSTYNVTSLGKELIFFSSSQTTNAGATFERLSESKFIGFYREPATPDVGYLTGFNVEPPVVVPTVTTQEVSSIDKTTATGNGNITATGGINPHLIGIAHIPGSSGDINAIPINNPSFENTLPDGWVNWGTGSVELSTTQVKYGTRSLKQNWVSGADACYQFHPTNPTSYIGKKVTFGCWVWSSTPTDGAYVSIFDYANPNWDASFTYHPGDSTWRFLTVTKTIRAGITDFMLRIGMTRNSAGSTYFDGVMAFYSDSVSPTLSFDSGNYSTGAFTKALTDLTPNTDYRATAFAQNSVGIANGVTVGFTTLKADESNFLLFM